MEKMTPNMTEAVMHLFAFFAKMLGLIAFLTMLLFIVPTITPHVKNAHQYSVVRKTLALERRISTPALQTMKRHIPTTILEQDISRWILVLLAFIAWWIFRSLGEAWSERARFRTARRYFDHLDVGEGAASSKVSEMAKKLRQKFTQANDGNNGKNRKDLLKQFVELKKTLDQEGKVYSFLAIDVVDSTKMKIGEDKTTVEYDFMEYNNLVKKIFDTHGCLNSSWTPDGVMACFPSAEAAVQAGRDLLEGLKDFNANVKQMKADFAVRCGINSGLVYYDPSTPLEEFSDRVVDIAGHMQKQAKPNTIYIAKDAIEPVVERSGFKMSGEKVDGVEAYAWGPQKVLKS